MADFQVINGNTFGWSSIALRVQGVPYFGVTEITYSDKRERSMGYGLGRNYAPLSRTAGKYSADNAKVKMRRSSAQELLGQLTLLRPETLGYGAAEVQIAVNFGELDLPPAMHTLERCAVVSVNDANTEGTEELMTELEFNVFYIIRNGFTLFDGTPF